MWIYRQQFLFVPDLKGSLPFSTTLTQSIHGMWAINLDVMFQCQARYRAERDSLLCACPNIIFYDTGGVMVIRRWNGDVAPVSIVGTAVTRSCRIHELIGLTDVHGFWRRILQFLAWHVYVRSLLPNIRQTWRAVCVLLLTELTPRTGVTDSAVKRRTCISSWVLLACSCVTVQLVQMFAVRIHVCSEIRVFSPYLTVYEHTANSLSLIQ